MSVQQVRQSRRVFQNIKTFKTTVTAEIKLHVWLQEPVQVYSTYASVSETCEVKVCNYSQKECAAEEHGDASHLQSQKIDTVSSGGHPR